MLLTYWYFFFGRFCFGTNDRRVTKTFLKHCLLPLKVIRIEILNLSKINYDNYDVTSRDNFSDVNKIFKILLSMHSRILFFMSVIAVGKCNITIIHASWVTSISINKYRRKFMNNANRSFLFGQLKFFSFMNNHYTFFQTLMIEYMLILSLKFEGFGGILSE